MSAKDLVFVDALIRAALVDPTVIRERIDSIGESELDDELTAGGGERKRRMLTWIEGYPARRL